MPAHLILILALLIVGGQEPRAPTGPPVPSASPYVERDQRQFSFYPGGKLQVVAGVPGNVKIIGWGRSSVMLQIERIIYNLEPDLAKVLSSQYPLQLKWNQTSATIRTSGPPKSAATMEINLTIYVPKERTDINAQIMQGDLAVGTVNGWVEADLSSGSIVAKSMSGYFSALTKQGDISVEMSGKHWTGHEFSAVTRKGSVDLMLPADYSAALFVEARNGKLIIQFPEQKVDGQSVPLPIVTKKNSQSLSGAVGDGGAPIKLMTMSGDARLSAISGSPQ